MNQPGPSTRDSNKKLLLLPVMALALILLPVAAFVPSCQSRMIYFPRPYPAGTTTQWKQTTGGRSIDFHTSQGKQRAFLQGNLKHPRNLWIVCGGNGTVALDWSDWLQTHAPKDDAWLLVDFPGYGDCQGSPSPSRIRETFQSAVPLACESLGWNASRDKPRLRFFGHSLGAAACMMAASEFGIQRGVLLAPFTSTSDMAAELTGLPVGFLVIHRFDNSARLAELAARGKGRVNIVHGTDDEVIPVAMGRSLAASIPGTGHLTEIPGGRHNDIQENHAMVLARALQDAGGS